MLRRILLTLLLLSFCAQAQAQEPGPANRAEIVRLLEAMGSREMIQQYSKQALGIVRKMRPDIPAGSLPTVERELQAFITEKIGAPGGLLEQMIPLVAKRFTVQEVHELAAFYESPTGRKALVVLPQLTKEAKDAAQRLAIGLAPEMSNRITEALKREAEQNAAKPDSKPDLKVDSKADLKDQAKPQ